jgi:hypothetical protein
MAERIRLSRARGWRLPENAVNIARPGKWGNPFVVGRDGTRLQCAAMFAQLARGFIDLGGRVSAEAQLQLYLRVRDERSELEGRDLACWCALDGGACHGDILLHLANGTPLPEWCRGEIELPRVRLGMAADDFKGLLAKRAKAGPVLP